MLLVFISLKVNGWSPSHQRPTQQSQAQRRPPSQREILTLPSRRVTQKWLLSIFVNFYRSLLRFTTTPWCLLLGMALVLKWWKYQETSSCNLQFFSELVTTQLRISHVSPQIVFTLSQEMLLSWVLILEKETSSGHYSCIEHRTYRTLLINN